MEKLESWLERLNTPLQPSAIDKDENRLDISFFVTTKLIHLISWHLDYGTNLYLFKLLGYNLLLNAWGPSIPSPSTTRRPSGAATICKALPVGRGTRQRTLPVAKTLCNRKELTNECGKSTRFGTSCSICGRLYSIVVA